MNKTWTSRIAAVMVLSVPIALWLVAREHAKAALLSTPGGIEQARYLSFLRHASFGRSFVAALIGGLLYVLLVEGLAYALRGDWRKASSREASA